MNELLKIEPRHEGSDEMVLVVPPEMAVKLEQAKFFPEYQSRNLTYHVVTTGLPIDTTELDDASKEDIQEYIQDNANWGRDTVDDCGVPFIELYPDHPFPFRDFPAPINEYLAKKSIRKHMERMQDVEDFDGSDDSYVNDLPITKLEARAKDDAVMYSKSFTDAVIANPSLVHYTTEEIFEREKANINRLATECALPDWEVIFYLKVYDKLKEKSIF